MIKICSTYLYPNQCCFLAQMFSSLHWAGHAQLPTTLSRPIHSRWYWKRLVSHCLMSWIDRIYYLAHCVSQSVFLYWIIFTFVSISFFHTGLPHSQMNKSLRFQVQHDLPTWVWKNTVKKLISDEGQPWGFFSKTWHFWLVHSNGILDSGTMEKIVLPLLIWLLLPNGPASLY